MQAVFLHGRGLVSALGPDLPAALACLKAGGVAPAQLEVGPGIVWPYFTIDATESDWYARARRLVRQAVAECGAVDRTAPLFLASCSLDVGALEDGAPADHDCQQAAERVAGWLDWQGPVIWISTACTSASNAVLAACATLQAGEARHALVLGLELANRFTSAGFGAMGLLDTQRPRPLAADRAGLVLGEAVAALWLGTTPARWRIAGGANVVDGSDAAGATPAAVAQMCTQALASAGLHAGDIDLIKLQAAGSPGNDATEIAGLRSVFAELPPLVSLKAEMGHTLGASVAAELALLTASLETGVWPTPRAAADAEFGLTQTSAAAPTRTLMSTILGFGGGHATLILEDCTHRPDAGGQRESGSGDSIPTRERGNDQPGERSPAHPGLRCASSGLRITGRYFASPPPPDWRERLAARLGAKPRRIGRWAELVLYGALECLADAGETTLPAGTLLSLASLLGPDQALRAALVEARDGQPMPLGFLQSQPNQALAHLAKALNWRGDARCLTTRDPLAALRLACSRAGPGGVLLGWVAEDGEGSSQWLRLLPVADGDYAPLPTSLDALGDPACSGFRLI
ncbi:beta-ketoacyl synthase N-terminal-like domain-containing protein [Uliginosibacterium sp. 31-16]|uniref:beta-ketoacyl synthase N-terminal-like domain-containing protein n=1 Tax=Uliginosibacterium sp. 31-16 TaxID=3068315 RepID=UPI00273EA3DA|nr:beta-ketoacyl synthase N-terminal-like domain-containing protein [Uliginosibacterium sp. 31-16]MDP5240955.1 beta-ketoacyl synthase N-terminal-like domain-containing protein [Uliginosibacterium sp. 31-16]